VPISARLAPITVDNIPEAALIYDIEESNWLPHSLRKIEDKIGRSPVPAALDATKLPSHDIFYMEGVGGYREPESTERSISSPPEHAPSCFAFEEEMGGQWTGAGSAAPSIKDGRPTL
jgi:hypothetical protein